MITAVMFGMLTLGAVTPVEVAPGETVSTWSTGEARTVGTVVLVPGLTGCAYGFRHLVENLTAAGCRVLVVEPLGVGSSSRPSDADYSLTAQSDRLARVIEIVQTGPGLVVAHGVAGSMALRLAYRRPDLVLGVVSIEGGPDENCLTPTVERTLGLVSLAVKLGAKRMIRDRFRSSLEAASGDCGWISDITVRRYFQGAERNLSASVDALRAMAASREIEPLQANLPRIACPVTLLLGGAEHEGSPSPAAVALLQSSLPNVKVRTVPGAGHFIFEEQPSTVADTVLDMVRECRVATGAGAVGLDASSSDELAAGSAGGASCAQ